MPRLRGGVPVVGAVRAPDGRRARGARTSIAARHGRRPRRGSPSGSATASCSRATGCSSPSRGCSPSRSACTWCRGGSRLPRLSMRVPARDRSEQRADAGQRRRVPVPRVRDGRVAARHAPGRAARDGGSRRAPRAPRPRRRLLRRAAHPRRPGRTRRAGSPAASSASMPGDAPVVVDSAGCGAAMKDYGRLLGTPRPRVRGPGARLLRVARRRSGRCRCEPPARRSSCRTRATCATCSRRPARSAAVLAPAYRTVETDDDGLCCGAGGAYTVLQPELAAAIRDRKVAAIRVPPAAVHEPARRVGEPGLRDAPGAAGLDVRHPAELLAEALDG